MLMSSAVSWKIKIKYLVYESVSIQTYVRNSVCSHKESAINNTLKAYEANVYFVTQTQAVECCEKLNSYARTYINV